MGFVHRLPWVMLSVSVRHNVGRNIVGATNKCTLVVFMVYIELIEVEKAWKSYVRKRCAR